MTDLGTTGLQMDTNALGTVDGEGTAYTPPTWGSTFETTTNILGLIETPRSPYVPPADDWTVAWSNEGDSEDNGLMPIPAYYVGLEEEEGEIYLI